MDSSGGATQGHALGIVPRAVIALIAVIALAAVAGCGSDESSSGGGKISNDPAATKDYEALLKGVGFKEPPADGPAGATGKKVWVLSCSQSLTLCSVAANSMMDAGEALGWDMTLFDTKFDPNLVADGFRKAIASGADGVLTYITDCAIATQPLKEAKAAGVLTSSAESLDCDPPLYDAVVTYSQGDYAKWLEDYGAAQATAAIAGTDGEAKVIPTKAVGAPTGDLVYKGFADEIAKCDACEIVDTVEFTIAELGTPLQEKMQQALVSHPEANAINVGADSYFNAGVEAALRSAGRIDSVFLSLGEGDPTIMDRLRSGELESAGIGVPVSWEAYAAVDSLNRLFAGQQPVPSGIGLQAFDQDHNVPDAGSYQPPIDDVEQTYLDSWGVSGQG